MELARHRALTPSTCRDNGVFHSFCRNGVSPPQGIDTVPLPVPKIFSFGRNGVSPPQGIDTILAVSAAIRFREGVEMELARHRALTRRHFGNICQLLRFVEMELARHRALTQTSACGCQHRHSGRNGVSPPQGIDTSSIGRTLPIMDVEMELARHRA